MSTPQIILGSASAARAGILRRAGIPFTQLPADIDEAAHGMDITEPRVQAQHLALAKAHAVANLAISRRRPEEPTYILAADSVFEFQGQAYGKPHQPQIAKQRWLQQRGKSGTLHSGHCLIAVVQGQKLRVLQQTVSAQVTFAQVSSDVIDDYVATGEPLHVAGGFTLEGHGATMISSIHGDPNAVLGLSLRAVREMLARVDVSITKLWNPTK